MLFSCYCCHDCSIMTCKTIWCNAYVLNTLENNHRTGTKQLPLWKTQGPFAGLLCCVLWQKLYCHNKLSSPRSRNGNWWTVNPLTPVRDWDRISPYYIYAISCRQVMRIKKNINYWITNWSDAKFSKLTW